jgi:D-alanyl-D-alanine carboxypeptidase/D-alanyl-D-alanine-endopeptidase (penicillin-binding protein 4)
MLGVRSALVINGAVLTVAVLAAAVGQESSAATAPLRVVDRAAVSPQVVALPLHAKPAPRASSPRVTPVPTRAPQLIRPQAVAAPAGPPSSAAIRSRLAAELARSGAANRSSAVTIDSRGDVLRERATTAVVPASATKLFTTLAALKVVGLNTRFRTEVRATKPATGSVQPGNIYLVAGGDPFLMTQHLDYLAASIKRKGITRVTGALLLDDSRYDRQVRGPGWKTSYVPDESGPLSAFAVDRNTWRKDAQFVADPAMANLGKFKALLTKHGISTVGSSRRSKPPAGSVVLVGHSSPVLSSVITNVNKKSDNFAAELLLKEVGFRARGVGSTASGVAAATTALRAMGVRTGRQIDGSGLASANRQTSDGALSLLTAAYKSPQGPALRASLAIACRDGTLLRRMCSTPASGRARAKTGTLPGAYALAGYTTTANGRQVRYAFLLNGASDSVKARAAMDKCVVYLSTINV